MKTQQEFEALVYERAELIKARDRQKKLIRMSVLPIAAALVVLTAVGLHRIPSLSDNITALQNGASGESAYNDNAYYAAEDSYREDEDDAEYNTPAEEPEQSYDNDIIEYSGEGQDTVNEAPKAEQYAADEIAVSEIDTLVFEANSTVECTDPDIIEEVVSAAEELPEGNFEAKGYNGKLLAYSDGVLVARCDIYGDHLNITKSTGDHSTRALSDSAKSMLSQYFSIDFS